MPKKVNPNSKLPKSRAVKSSLNKPISRVKKRISTEGRVKSRKIKSSARHSKNQPNSNSLHYKNISDSSSTVGNSIKGPSSLKPRRRTPAEAIVLLHAFSLASHPKAGSKRHYGMPTLKGSLNFYLAKRASSLASRLPVLGFYYLVSSSSGFLPTIEKILISLNQKKLLPESRIAESNIMTEQARCCSGNKKAKKIVQS